RVCEGLFKNTALRCCRCGDCAAGGKKLKSKPVVAHSWKERTAPEGGRYISSRHSRRSCLLPDRGHINYEAVLHVALQQAFVGMINLLDADFFDVSGYTVFTAEVQHFLRFANTT